MERERVPLYRSGDPDADAYDLDAFDENPADHRVAPYALRQSFRTDVHSTNSVPLFLSDDNGEPDPDEYIVPLTRKRRASISSKILAVVCAAAVAAVLVALLSSDATRSFAVNIKASMASMAAIFPAPSAAAQSDSSHLTARKRQNDAARASAEDQASGARGAATGTVAPAREDIRLAYQNALQQGRGQAAEPVAAAPAAEPTAPEPSIHHLDPDTIAALLKRADGLIASGDVAAARLVLRRAADAGDARAAMTLAETYDPAFLEKLGVHGFVPDLAMARSWYEKARAFGSAEAPQRLETLASKRQ
jgi:hypothetical protein